jgi:hypothetical protein
MAEAGYDHALADLPPGMLHHMLAYSKAGLVFDMLSREVGLEKFRTALRQICERYTFQEMTLQDFWKALEASTKTDLGWFFEQWFQRTGAPEWQIDWNQNGADLEGMITQTAPYYRATLDVLVTGKEGQHELHSVEARSLRTTIRFRVDFPVLSVVIDPHFRVLHWTPEYHAVARAMAPYTRQLKKQQLGQPADLQKGLKESVDRVPTPDMYAIRSQLEFTWAQLLMEQSRWAEARAHLERALASPTRPKGDLPWMYYRLAQIAQQLHDDRLLRTAVDGAVSADAAADSKSGAGAAAQALLNERKRE